MNIESIRHSLSHIMTMALEGLYGKAGLGVGPAIDDGWYQDFDFPSEVKISSDDFSRVEKKMKEIIDRNLDIIQQIVDYNEAQKLAADDPYKLELIEDLKKSGETNFSFFTIGDFVNLCAGPHVGNTRDLKQAGWQIDRLAGAYWKGDERNKQLTRIYGLGFANTKELRQFLTQREEAQKRDHRKLGKKLDLFSVSEKVGPGLILWHPKLAKVREAVEEFWRKFHRQRGYHTVYTPHIGRSNLWQTSGHLDFFRESMYSAMDIEGEEYFAKPMNCPFHVEIYKSQPRSWRDFPFRWNELGSVYRYEKSGELTGLLRVRGFTQDDAHIICRPDQFVDEYREVLKFTLDIFEIFGFQRENVKGYIAVRDPHSDKYAGTDAIWTEAEKTVRQVTEEFGIPHEVEEGGAKFYGPALDLKIQDAIGREWQLTTIQLDFNLPEKFNMTFSGPEKEEQPIMIHRALLGSLERFFAILIEHYAGAFPTWLAPVQAAILPVSEKHAKFAQQIFDQLLSQDLRPKIYEAEETLGKRIRAAEMEKVPYILVVGDKEFEDSSVTVRQRGVKEQVVLKLNDFIERLKKEVKEKINN